MKPRADSRCDALRREAEHCAKVMTSLAPPGLSKAEAAAWSISGLIAGGAHYAEQSPWAVFTTKRGLRFIVPLHAAMEALGDTVPGLAPDDQDAG